MKAIRYHGPKDLRLEDIPEPVVGPGQVKVKVCGRLSFVYLVLCHNRVISDCLVSDASPTLL